jgi:hypothetical protein
MNIYVIFLATMELPCFAYKIQTKTHEYLAKNTFHTKAKAKKRNIVLSDSTQ